MLLSTLLRSGPAAWTALVLIPALCWLSLQNTGSTIATWDSVTAQSTIVLGFVSAACGACAAWEASRIRTAHVLEWAPARSRLRIATEHLVPTAALGLTGLAAALAVHAPPALGGPGLPDPAILATAHLVVLGHMAAGYLLGLKAPRLLAAAVMLTGGYLWGFWPAALGEAAWLRHLNGQGIGECCSLDRQPSLRSLGATAVFSLGLIAAALAVLLLDRSRKRTASAWALFLACALTAATLAVPLGFDGTQPRDASAFRCTGSKPQVCLWPEQQPHRNVFVREATGAAEHLRAVGLQPPARIEFGMVKPGPSDIRTVTAAGLLPTEPPACSQGPGAHYPGDAAFAPLYVWLALTAGSSPDSLAGRWPQEAISLAQQVRTLPVPAQRAWYDRNLRALHDCRVQPEPDPAKAAAPGDGAP
ncbi:hypothetical protein ACFSJS_16425 [Streptomyces desertarenae]|uniref:DUF7224 domain-containing protein n=1 Tax=Streptomyces desertarenae TaxID=2666184 RepID=A0ABW4PMN9_9ACTN